MFLSQILVICPRILRVIARAVLRETVEGSARVIGLAGGDISRVGCGTATF